MIDYDNITLDHIDTSRFYVDIKIKGFVKTFKNINSKFDIRHDTLTSEPILKYIALLYDPRSEIRNAINHYPTRKRIAAKLAGFPVDENGHFTEDVEKMIWGEIPHVNNAIIQYAFLSTLNIFFVASVAYREMYFKELSRSLNSYNKDTIANLGKLQEKVIENENKIFGGDETEKLREALYAETSKLELPTPENVVKKLEAGEDLKEYNPFSDNYIPEKLAYAGVTPPEEV
jgi:hypothetical protein